MITDTDVAWAAGFYEGEGSAQNANSRKSGKGRGSLMAIIPQTNKEPLEKMHRLFGGSLFPTNAYKKNKNWNQAFQWCIASRQAKIFLTLSTRISRQNVGCKF